MHSGHLFNPVEPFNNFNSVPFSSNQDYVPASAAMSAGVVSPLTRGKKRCVCFSKETWRANTITVPEHSQYDFSQPPQRHSWGSPFPDSTGYSSPGEGSAHALWGRHSDSPVTPGFSPHLSGPTSSMTSFSDSRGSLTSFAPSRNDSWSAHPRSMSFGLVEGLPANGFDVGRYYPHSMSKETRRRASDMRPPSLQTSATSSNTSISEPYHTPLSAPIPSPPSAPWNLSSGPWSALPGTVMNKPYETGWFSDGGPLPKVAEEEIPSQYIGEPPLVYTGVEGT